MLTFYCNINPATNKPISAVCSDVPTEDFTVLIPEEFVYQLHRARLDEGVWVLDDEVVPSPEPEPKSPEQIQIDALNDIAAQLLLDSAAKEAMISQQSDMIAGLMMTVAQLQGGE